MRLLLGLVAFLALAAVVAALRPEPPRIGGEDARDARREARSGEAAPAGADRRPRGSTPTSSSSQNAPVSVRGLVRRADTGAPVEGARVLALACERSDVRESVSGGDGTFEVPGSRDARGAFHLVVEKEGLASRTVGNVQPSRETIEVLLSAGGTLEGRVVDTDGPVTAYRILAVRLLFQPGEPFDLNRTLLDQTVPRDLAIAREVSIEDAEGRFRLEALEPGRYALLVAAPGRLPRFWNGGGAYYERERGLDVREGEVTSGIEIPLPERGAIRIRVTDAATGEPLTGVSFEAIVTVGDHGHAFPVAPIREGVAGEYELPADIHTEWQSGGLDFLQLRLSKAGHVDADLRLGGQRSGETLETSLGRGGRVRGAVRDGTGRPAEGATVLLLRDADRGLLEVLAAGPTAASSRARSRPGRTSRSSPTTPRSRPSSRQRPSGWRRGSSSCSTSARPTAARSAASSPSGGGRLAAPS